MNEKGISRKMIIIAALFLGICMIVPVWQSSVSTRLSLKINVIDTKIVALQDQRTQVKAQIERMTDSENLRQVALLKENSSNLAGNI